ncbi:MAG: hypothetical protein U0326_42925 [Polyangiales bacterium]
MTRPRTIAGLALAALRARNLTRPALGAIALTALALTGLSLRSQHARSLRHAPAWAEAEMRRGLEGDGDASFHDLSMIATPRGWLLSWVRSEYDAGTSLQVASLDAEGKLRGAPTTLTSARVFARFPRVARGPRGNAVTWAATDRGVFQPRVFFATVDDDAKVLLAPRALSDDLALAPDLASDNEGWAVGWTSVERPNAYALTRLDADGAPRGEPVRIPDGAGVYRSALTWNGSAWTVALNRYLDLTDESFIELAWVDRAGRNVGRKLLARSRGAALIFSGVSHGASTWLAWGEDGQFWGGRHNPQFARVDDRTIAAGPRPLGPRRSGGGEAIACDNVGCTVAWAAVEEHERGRPEFWVQRYDTDGAPRSPARIVGARGRAAPWSSSAVALSLDGAAGLAAYTANRDARGGVIVVRLNAEGVPSSPPRDLPLR